MDEIKQSVGVGGLLFRGGKILIVKRSDQDEYLPGQWEMAGGGLELGENPAKAVEREYLEETNLAVRAIKPYHVFAEVVEAKGKHYIEIDYILELKDDIENLKLSEEHSEYKWINKSEVEEYEMTDFMREALYLGFREHNIF